MHLLFSPRPFVDSEVPAHDFDGNLVSEEEWQRIADEDLLEYKKYDDLGPEFKAMRKYIISRISRGKRSQRLYNQYIELI